ncbi:MAG: hypothetical protein H6739_27965 [Alphaproteobacteria bacterium]|nr:hypothetical protein [Alphaproteobacteria bacterium]
MSVKRMRPTFQMVVPLPPVEVLQRVREALDEPECLCAGTMGGHGFELMVDEMHRHFWSPWLTVEVRPHDQGAKLWARFSPQPQVWTLFIALYATTAVIGIGGAVYGMAQATLDQTPTAMWAVPAAGLLALIIYVSSFVGQGLGGAQMYVLRRFLDQCLPPPIPNAA